MHTVNQGLPATREQTFMNILNRSDLLYLFSQESSGYIQSKYKIQPTKIVVIPHGVPNIEFKLPHDNPKINQYSNEIVFVSAGHMRDSKGYDIAIRALNILRKENIAFHYYIIGSNHPENESANTYRNVLLALVDKLSLKGKVTFINDYLPLKDLIDFIQLADVCLLPYSRKEQSSSGVLSLMIACGRPIVSTPFQFATCQMTNSSGTISESFFPADYAIAIKSLIRDRHSWEKIMLHNYTIGRSWGWTQVAKLYSLGYDMFLNK